MVTRFGAILAACTLVLAACGDDGGSDDAVPTTTAEAPDDDNSGADDGSTETNDGDHSTNDEGQADDASSDEGSTDEGPADDEGANGDRERESTGGGDADPGDGGTAGGDPGDDTEETVGGGPELERFGECVAESIGVGAVAPDGWVCTSLDAPLPGIEGFILRSEGSTLEITIGTPIPFGPCDFEGFCETVEPIAIVGFSDAYQFSQDGVAGGVVGTHDERELALTASKIGAALDADELELVLDYVATLTLF